jgi:CRP-like cAMP-binding protein
VLAAGRLIKKLPGEYYFFQDDPADVVYVLASGRLRLGQVTADGQQILLRVITPWTPFGAVAMVTGEKYPVSAEAAQECTAYGWTKTVIDDLMDRIPRLALNAMKILAGHAQEFQERFQQLATQRVERRLANTILRLASQTGKKTEEGVVIDLPLTRQDLAEMTGTTLYTVSRIFSQWESQGLVHSSREKVVIKFPHGLVKIAEEL